MLIRADARHIPMVDGCVQCVVTSPPYWGLRDYGTARWSGGDDECDHRQQLGGEGLASAKQNTSAGTQTIQYRQVCGKCGARRIDSQLGLEPTPDAYVQSMVAVFTEVWRVLKDDGTAWLNLGDSYAQNFRWGDGDNISAKQRSNRGSRPFQDAGYAGAAPARVVPGIKQKDLVGIPWRVAFALQAAGWYLRSDIIWSKPNPMPESVTDRPTKAHEYIFLLSKRERYYYNAAAVAESCSEDMQRRAARGHTRGAKGKVDASRHDANTLRGDHSKIIEVSLGRNKRSVWHVATQPYSGSHFATFPEALIEPCILAGSRPGDLVYDPFIGSGTTGAVCDRLMRRWVGTDLSYQDLSKKRTAQRGLKFEASA